MKNYIIDNISSKLYFKGFTTTGKRGRYEFYSTFGKCWIKFTAKTHAHAAHKFWQYEYVSAGCIRYY